MGRVKYEKILVLNPTIRGTSELRDIVNTYLEGVPHIKCIDGPSYYLVIADIGCTSKILLNMWFVMARHQMHTFYSTEYSHYKSEGGYCYFSTGFTDDTLVLRSKDLKVLWD